MELVIKRKDIINMSKELIKEVYEFLNDDYFIETFPEYKNKLKNFNNNLFQIILDNSNRIIKLNVDEEEMKERVLKMIKEKILDNKVIYYFLKNLNPEDVYESLSLLNLDIELNEDLCFKIEAFLRLYKVFDSDYSYLKD